MVNILIKHYSSKQGFGKGHPGNRLNETIISSLEVNRRPQQPLLLCNGKIETRVCLWNADDGLQLSCINMGGFPIPKLQWFKDHKMSTYGVNKISISQLDLRLTSDEVPENGTLFTCKAVQGEFEESLTLKLVLPASNNSLISTTSPFATSTTPSSLATNLDLLLTKTNNSTDFMGSRKNKKTVIEEELFSSWIILVVLLAPLITLSGVLVFFYVRFLLWSWLFLVVCSVWLRDAFKKKEVHMREMFLTWLPPPSPPYKSRE